MTTRASARQPKDAVPGDKTVRVPKYFINGKEFTSIDFGTGYKPVLGWRKATEDRPEIHFAKQPEIHIRSELGAAN